MRLSATDRGARDLAGNCKALLAAEQAGKDAGTIIRSCWGMLKVEAATNHCSSLSSSLLSTFVHLPVTSHLRSMVSNSGMEEIFF